MATPTSVSLTVDLDEYSKFEVDRDTITISWSATSTASMSGEVLRFQLTKARRSRDAVVHQVDATITGSGTTETGETTISLPDVTQDQINLIRRGYYFIKMYSVTDNNVTASTPDFPISILTAQELRNSYLFGLSLNLNDVRQVQFQPTQITGVEIEEVSASHPTTFAQLTYTYNASPLLRQLSWYGGPMVNITAPGRYILKYDCTGGDYIIVRVRSLSALPTTTITEELIVGKDQITDDMLRRWIEQACDWWENDRISVFLEPTRVVTDPVLPDATILDYDFIVPPITFYPVNPARWIDILFPYPGLLQIDELFGNIADTRIVDVDLSWIEISERNGLAQLVPFNQNVAFQYIGLVWVESLRGRIELPNFWHFNALAGLRQVDPVVLEVLAKKAGIDALTIAGQAFRGGFSSQSLSRDGVSESVSYTASAIYGIYSATIEDFNKFINREIRNLRGRYRGVNMIVM